MQVQNSELTSYVFINYGCVACLSFPDDLFFDSLPIKQYAFSCSFARIVYQLQPHKPSILDKVFFVGVKEFLTKNHHRRTIYLTSVEIFFRMM